MPKSTLLPLVLVTTAVLLAPLGTARAADEAPQKPWEFPKEVAVAGRRMFLSEPIVLSRDAANGRIKLRFAAKITDPIGREFYGVADCEGVSHLDLTSRLVIVDQVKAGTALEPQLPDADRDPVIAAIPDVFPKEFTLRLELLTAAPWAAPKETIVQGKISLLAPEILTRTAPAMLIQFDGEPVFQPVGDFPVEYAINTASDIFKDPKSGKCVLLADGRWYESKAAIGPWQPMGAGVSPILSMLSQLPSAHARAHVRPYIMGTQEYAKRKPLPAANPVPEILVRDKPAELITLLGEPLLTWIPGTKLMNVANTESDLFFHPKTNAYYLTTGGRWFQSEDYSGPWKEVLTGLPTDFAAIPRDHPRGHVVYCVPGTPEANEAVARSLLEEKVTLGRAMSVEIAYEGKGPTTAPLDGLETAQVTNSEDDIFNTENAWWCCARGVWFRSDDGRSSWKPATQLAKSLAAIPEMTGAFHVRYCKALGATDDGPSFSVTAAYTGLFVANNTPIFGVGFAKRGTQRNGNWYPYPRAFGENRWYDPVTGSFQPRTVRYSDDGHLMATEWSNYTASYGRIANYADRYAQGGRRIFQWNEGEGHFDTKATRPDAYATWGTGVKFRDGIPAEKYGLVDRAGEASSKVTPLVADEAGAVWRLNDKAIETWDTKNWVAKDGASDDVKAWLATMRRLQLRADQTRAWAARRSAPLPANSLK